MRYVITGAGGFIGSRVSLAARLTQKPTLALRHQDVDILKSPLPLQANDHVIHCAAILGYEKWDKTSWLAEVNTLGTQRVLEACKQQGASLTFLSTYVYAPSATQPVDENSPILASNAYTLSKIQAEAWCEFYSRIYKVPVTVLRLFNPYGPNQPKNMLIPTIIEQLRSPTTPEIVVRDLSPRRDYIFINDVVEAIFASVPNEGFSVFNVGSGVAYSVEEIIQTACTILGNDKPYRALNNIRDHEIPVTIANTDALQRATEWRPKTTLEEGLKQLLL